MTGDPLDPAQWIGRKVAGRFRVIEELRRGGMGAVFLAMQEPLERKVALKIMLPGPAADAGSRRRFIQEAQALSRIPHRNIVTIFDFGEVDGGSLFIAMENIEGENLREALRPNTPVPWKDTIPVFLGIARALSIAHASQIVHRDLKPENVMLVGGRWTTDDVRLLDFGLARTLDSSEQLTQVNAIPGTPSYIAPERVVSRADDPRSDLYAMGAIWFELLTGQLPFGGETMAAVLLAHIQEPLPTFADVGMTNDVPEEIEDMVRRLLSKRPEDRWETVDQFLDELMTLGELLLGGERFGEGGARPAGTRSLDAIPVPERLPLTPRPSATPAPRPSAKPAPRPSATPATRRPTPAPTSASRWTTSSTVNEKVRFADPARSATAAATPALGTDAAILDPPDGAVVRPDAKVVLPGRTALLNVGKEAVTVQTEWSASKHAFVTVAVFKGRVLRRREVPVPPGTPQEELRPRMEAAHGWFSDEIKQLFGGLGKERAAHAQIFFLALEAYQRGDKETALRSLESLVLELPEDKRLKNSHMKLLLELGT